MKWGSQPLICTAKHIVENEPLSNLRVWTFPSGDPQTAEIEKNGFLLSDLGSELICCSWEDLAVIPITKKTAINLEFHDLVRWLDPSPGQKLSCIGFPTDLAETSKVTSVATNQEKIPHELKDLSERIWTTEVVNPPTNFKIAYTDSSPFDPDSHYLTTWVAPANLKPSGFSGTGLWKVSQSSSPLLKFDLEFAGVPTHFYAQYSMERVIKASVVREFLQQQLGTAK